MSIIAITVKIVVPWIDRDEMSVIGLESTPLQTRTIRPNLLQQPSFPMCPINNITYRVQPKVLKCLPLLAFSSLCTFLRHKNRTGIVMPSNSRQTTSSFRCSVMLSHYTSRLQFAVQYKTPRASDHLSPSLLSSPLCADSDLWNTPKRLFQTWPGS